MLGDIDTHKGDNINISCRSLLWGSVDKETGGKDKSGEETREGAIIFQGACVYLQLESDPREY